MVSHASMTERVGAPFALRKADVAGSTTAEAMVDGRFAPDVLEAAARRAVAAWADAVDGDDAALERAATPEAVRELLYAGDASERTRLVVRGPRLRALRITALHADATPREITPFQGRDNAFSRGFVGGHVGGQSDFSQRAHWFWSTRDLPCLGERDTEGGFQVKASGETEEPP